MAERHLLRADDLDALIEALAADERRVMGPTLRDGAVVYDEIEDAADLPRGWIDTHGAGEYRLSQTDDPAFFGALIGPSSARASLMPSRQVLFRATRQGSGFQTELPADPPRLALLGLRACDLAAINIQDQVLRFGATADPHYAARRSDVLLVAVQCARAAATCFCPSTGSGPRVSQGFDLCLTEVVEDDAHVFIIEVGSDAGAALLDRLPTSPAPDALAHQPEAAAESAEAGITKRLDGADAREGLRERLLDSLQSPHWDQVAQRCLGCGNCTLVCPTCFCTQVTDLTDLAGNAERVRTWDSCFTLEHGTIHGGSIRPDVGARYRQWLTHKLAHWWDQFDTSGCVGCGRCTTWCPAGIDLVEEALAAAAPEGVS